MWQLWAELLYDLLGALALARMLSTWCLWQLCACLLYDLLDVLTFSTYHLRDLLDVGPRRTDSTAQTAMLDRLQGDAGSIWDDLEGNFGPTFLSNESAILVAT